MPVQTGDLSQPTDLPAPVASQRWDTPGNRQAAARDAYRASVADGAALTGAALGAQFDRSPRWGTARIVEVRDKDIAREAVRTATEPVLPISTTGSEQPEHSILPPLPIGTNGRRQQTTDRNGMSNSGDRLPIGSDGISVDHRPVDGGATSAQVPAHPLAAAPRQHSQAVPTSLIIVTVTAVAIVAAVTMLTSYTHTHNLAALAGWGWLATVLPAAVDGLVVAGSTSLMVDRRLHGKDYRGHPLAWAALAIGLASSMAANIVAVDPTLVDMRVVRWVMAGYAPVALAISGHLLLRMLGERA